MKRYLVLLLTLFGLLGISVAQNVSYDAVQLSNLLMDRNWKNFENLIPIMLPGLKEQFEKGGATKDASRVFVEEFQNNLTKDKIGRAYASILSEKFNQSELRQLLEFQLSPLGSKAQELTNSQEFGINLVKGAAKSACDASREKLKVLDRESINSVCRGL